MKSTPNSDLTPLLTLVIPVFNEEGSLKNCLERIARLQETLFLEVVLVDDGSQDRSLEIAEQAARTWPFIRVFHQEKNQGKGAAVARGFNEARGQFVGIQDADLEYDPFELPGLLKPLLEGKADVVIGSRFISAGPHRVLYFWHYLGNLFLTLLSNIFTDLNLTDMESCYKIFTREVVQNLRLEESRFGIEPEIIARIAAMRLRIYELGITYSGRSYLEGKKIGVKDGFRAIYCIIYYNGENSSLPLQLMVWFTPFIGGIFLTGGFLPLPLALSLSLAAQVILGSHFLFKKIGWIGSITFGILSSLFQLSHLSQSVLLSLSLFFCFKILFQRSCKPGDWRSSDGRFR